MTSNRCCYLCGSPLLDGVNLHMDHLIPVVRGGVYCAENLRPACPACNFRKGAKLLEELRCRS
jgi:5-methylcytosine-specific restriction endonuclease McrA